MARETSYKTLKTESQFLKMVFANVVNRFGDSLDLIAFQWIAYQITQSPVWIAVIGGVNYLPNLILQPIAGVLVEKCSKKKIMIICDLGRAAITLSVAVMLITGTLNAWVLLLVTFLNSSLESFRLPAALAIRPHLISKDKYTVGMGLDSSLSRIVELVGFAIAGVIVAISPVLAVLTDFVSFLLSAVIISTIKINEVIEETKETIYTFFESFKGGLKYLNTNRLVLYLILWGAIGNLGSAAIVAYQAVYVADYLKLNAAFLSALSIASTLGMSLGALLAPKIRNKISGRLVLGLCGFVLGAVYVALAFIPGLRLLQTVIIFCVPAIMFVNGFTNGIVNVFYSSMLIENIEEGYVARVAGVFGAANALTIPLASFMLAGLSASLAIPVLFLISAVVTVLANGTALVFKEFKSL